MKARSEIVAVSLIAVAGAISNLLGFILGLDILADRTFFQILIAVFSEPASGIFTLLFGVLLGAFIGLFTGIAGGPNRTRVAVIFVIILSGAVGIVLGLVCAMFGLVTTRQI